MAFEFQLLKPSFSLWDQWLQPWLSNIRINILIDSLCAPSLEFTKCGGIKLIVKSKLVTETIHICPQPFFRKSICKILHLTIVHAVLLWLFCSFKRKSDFQMLVVFLFSYDISMSTLKQRPDFGILSNNTYFTNIQKHSLVMKNVPTVHPDLQCWHDFEKCQQDWKTKKLLFQLHLTFNVLNSLTAYLFWRKSYE